MPSREELYTALRNADKAGDADGARKLAAYIQSMPAETSTEATPAPSGASAIPGGGISQAALAGAAARGAPAVARTASDDSLLGKIVGPVDAGLALASGAVVGAAAPIVGFGKALLNPRSAKQPEAYADEFAAANQYQPRTGTGAQLASLVGRAAEPLGALPTAMLANVGQAAAPLSSLAGTAARAGAAALPDVNAGTLASLARAPVSAAGKVAAYPVNVVKAVAQPFTKAGQDSISGQIIQKFAQDGPTAINAAELIPGSAPTLAEATGNAGIARLQSAARDLAPNRFVAREQANSGARNKVFSDAAGDQSKLEYFKNDRATSANDLYNKASQVDPGANITPKVQRDIDELLKRPSIAAASQQARKFALERGDKPSSSGSLAGLHDTKTALDDMISKAIRDGEGGHANALQATKDKLLSVIETISPAYKEARATYSEMSKPINQMETLQGLKLTDARGNMTLQKVQSAIDTIGKRIDKPGIDAAKSLTSDQLNTLNALRDDLLRQSNQGLGRSAGSNTFQNLATDNIISTLLPGKLGELVKDKAGGVIGQIGKLAYSGPNEAIKGRLIDKMLDPNLAASDLKKLSDLAGKRKP